MTAHEIDNMVSWFLESLSEAQISKIHEKAIPFKKMKVMKFGLGVFQNKVLFLNISLSQIFSQEKQKL